MLWCLTLGLEDFNGKKKQRIIPNDGILSTKTQGGMNIGSLE